MSLRRLVVAGLASGVCLASLTGCGSTPTTPTDLESTTTLAGDAGRVGRLPLKADDLPTGFTAVDARSAATRPVISLCMPVLSGSPASQIGETFARQGQEVVSQSFALPTAALATNALATLTDPTVKNCLAGMVQTEMESLRTGGGLTGVSVTSSMTPLDPSTAQFRSVATKSGDSASLSVAAVDLLVLQSDRTLSAVWLTWSAGVPDSALENRAITALRARSSAAFSNSVERQ